MRANPTSTIAGLALLLSATACSPSLPSSPTMTAPAASPPSATFTTRVISPSVTPRVGTGPPPTPAATETSIAVRGPALPADQSHFQDGEDIQLTRIEMVSRTEGWGVAGAYVLKTLDGGQTWHEVTPPMQSINAATTEAFGAFLDPQNAWVVFGVDDPSSPYPGGIQIPRAATIWNTSDGGSTWSATEVIQEAYGDSMGANFYAVDPTRIWVAFHGVYVGAGRHFTGSLLRTTNGGMNWELSGDLTDYTGYFNDDHTGMVFADSDVGWLTWETTHAWGASPPAYSVTDDGGASWEVRTLPPPADTPTLFEDYHYSEPYQPNLVSAQSIRLLVGSFEYDTWSEPDQSDARNSRNYLYATEDGGEHWQMYALPPNVLASEAKLIFFDGDTGMLLGREMYRTEDGGRSWDQVKTVFWDGQFSFVDSQYGWAVARSSEALALVKTVDGGRSWAELEPQVER